MLHTASKDSKACVRKLAGDLQEFDAKNTDVPMTARKPNTEDFEMADRVNSFPLISHKFQRVSGSLGKFVETQGNSVEFTVWSFIGIQCESLGNLVAMPSFPRKIWVLEVVWGDLGSQEVWRKLPLRNQLCLLREASPHTLKESSSRNLNEALSETTGIVTTSGSPPQSTRKP